MMLYCLARNSSSEVVGAQTNVGRVDESGGGGSDCVGESSIGSSIWVASIASIEESRVSLSFTLAIVVTIGSIRVSSIGIRSIALGGEVKSLGDGVKTSAGAERNSSSISTVQESGISLSLSLTLAIVVDKSVPSCTGHGDISSVDTGSALEANTVAESIGVASITSVEQGGVSLGTDASYQGRCYDQKFHDADTALIFLIQLMRQHNQRRAGRGQPR